MAHDSNFSEVIHIETLQKQNSLLPEENIVALVEKWLQNGTSSVEEFDEMITTYNDPELVKNVSCISLHRSKITANGYFPKFIHYVYRFNSFVPETQGVDDEQQISTQWILPTEDFHGLWESLIYDGNIKNDLLNYVSTALQFSERNVNCNIITWNRIVLLHGPPGTGKTSLCKALAQKISIRFKSKFHYGHFVEVNTHSLFSKWFSESGKLVTRMFQDILGLLEDPNVLVIVLLDEVESLARSRASALNGNEPSDALRVVNALLTHLDMIKRYPNVLILTTSNITEAIDVALIDRADIKQFIGLPPVEAIYKIYCTCIIELQRAEIIVTGECYKLSSWADVSRAVKLTSRSEKLRAVAEKSVGLSGRSLRKLPFIACSLYIKSAVTVEEFINALEKAVEKHWTDVKSLKVYI